MDRGFHKQSFINVDRKSNGDSMKKSITKRIKDMKIFMLTGFFMVATSIITFPTLIATKNIMGMVRSIFVLVITVLFAGYCFSRTIEEYIYIMKET